MTHLEEHEIVLTKPAYRNLQPKVIEKNITEILSSINTRSLANSGWIVEKGKSVSSVGNQPWKQRLAPYTEDAEYIYNIFFVAKYCSEKDKKPNTNALRALVNTINKRAQGPLFGRWSVETVDDEKFITLAEMDDDAKNALLGYADVVIPEDWDDHFAHLYGLDPNIAMVKRAIEAGIMSNWSNRYHCALVGPPGCGKSDICRSLTRALGEDAVLEFDATATTAAGAIKQLDEREILPRILVVEEIEKADEKSMSFLLGVLDLRGEIRKTTARANVERETKLFAIATVNDIPLFKRLQAGALASRFSNQIGFKRPTRKQLNMILEREINKIKGDKRWIKPALDYCFNLPEPITDPRKVTAICLCGRELLLTGEYQDMLRETSRDISVPEGAM